MALMSLEYIAQNDVVQRYLHGNLSAEELVEFEKTMLLHPEILEDIELTQAFKRGLELSVNGEVSKPKPSGLSSWSWLWTGGGLVTGALASWLLLGPLSFAPLSQSSLLSPDIVYVDTVRGAIDNQGSDAQAFISSQNNRHLLVFDVSRFNADNYQLTLENHSGAVLQQWSNIKPNEKNELVIQTEFQGVSKQHYLLLLRTAESDNILMKTRLTAE